MPLEGFHQYTKEGHKNNYFDNESDMLKFLSQFENKASEYNIEKVKDFCTRMGLECNYPIVILSGADHVKAVEMKPIGTSLRFESLGHVESMSRVIVIRVDEVLEKNNGGQLFTESILVHEITHRDSFKYTISNYNDNDRGFVSKVKDYRHGFCIYCDKAIDNGVLEEGFAEFVRFKYLKENWDAYPLSKVAYTPESTFSVSMPNIKLTQMPATSVHFNKEGGFENCLPGSSLQIIHLLIRLNPNIEKDLFLARKSTEGYIKLLQDIEKIQKGLYPKIRSTIYNGANSAKLVNEIAQLLNDPEERKRYN
jgi:hypothetical protein